MCSVAHLVRIRKELDRWNSANSADEVTESSSAET